MNPQKIGRFLALLSEEAGGDMSAVGMFHYIMTVEAMYLQMMSVYHIHNEDMDGFVQQLEMFTEHAQKLIKIMSGILKLDQESEEFENDGSIYYGATGFCQVWSMRISLIIYVTKAHLFIQLILSEEEESIDKVLPFITDETLHKPILMKDEQDEKNKSIYNIFPLYLAATTSRWSLLPKMLERGSDVNKLAVSVSGFTDSCLSQAASQGAVEAVKLLLLHGAKVNHGNALSGAVEVRNEELVRILLEAGEDPNRPDRHGETALYKAMKLEDDDNIKEILLNAGADLRLAKFCDQHKEKEEEKRVDEERMRKEEEERKAEEERVQKKKEEERKKKEEERKKTEPRTITARSMTPELKEVNFYGIYLKAQLS